MVKVLIQCLTLASSINDTVQGLVSAEDSGRYTAGHDYDFCTNARTLFRINASAFFCAFVD